MMSWLGAISFLNPWALAGLIVLPIIYWLLRFIPPQPQSVQFPPFRLLRDLVSKNEEVDKTPWWLVVLRLALAAAIIIAIAQPIIGNQNRGELSSDPLLIVVDNDWSTAANWQLHQTVMLQTIENARAKGVPIAVVASATTGKLDIKMQNANSAQKLAGQIAPQSFSANRTKLVGKLKTAFSDIKTLQIIWLSNGLKDKSTAPFIATLKDLANSKGKLSIIAPPASQLPVILSNPTRKNGKIIATIHRSGANPSTKFSIKLLARNGRNLAQVPIVFKDQATTAIAKISLPLALRNEAASLQISDQNHAGAVFLIDDQWKRKTVGIIAGQSLELAQPLLSPLYYVTRALLPTAEVAQPANQKETLKLLQSGLSMLVMADIGTMPAKQHAAISNWVKKGGVLVRFAGPRLAEKSGNSLLSQPDLLVPVKLRHGGRSLGSALSWDQPQTLAPFNAEGPLAGLKVETDVTVRRQVLAEPTADLSGRVWASLNDGTPLITAAKHEGGLVVLIHVTANSDWSNLPLSGMFVKILERILSLAPAVTTSAQTKTGDTTSTIAGPFAPYASLDGFARLGPPVSTAKPIKPAQFAKTIPNSDHPAGLYRNSALTKALNLSLNQKTLTPLARNLSQIKVSDYSPTPTIKLVGWFFIAATVLFLVDCLATLFLMGGVQKLKTRAGFSTAIVLAGFVMMAGIESTSAQEQAKNPVEQRAMEALKQSRFAYVLTGDNQVDATSFAGLNGLNMALRQRTSVDPGRPHGIDLEKDEIVFYPLLYWPVLKDAQTPSEKVIIKLRSFMKNGGTIFFDTRDQNATFSNLTSGTSPQTQALRRILGKFDIPALAPVPPRHVLTRAFYLMQQFPGRWLSGKLWVEASTTDKSQNDGVSSIIIGANDYAAAWAIDLTGKPLYATIPGAPRQREFAYRTGINIVMYTLTGNYKADQVHVPALLRRLGQ